MILQNLKEYHRPAGMEEALGLLGRSTPRTALLMGDLSSVAHIAGEVEAIVDAEDLGLGTLEISEAVISIGTMVTLQTLVDQLDGLISETAHRTLAWNERNSVTVGGLLINGSWAAPLSVVLEALAASVTLATGDPMTWADAITTRGIFPLSVEVSLERAGAAYHQIGRTPADMPIISAAATVADMGDDAANVRLAVGGYRADGLATMTGSIHLGPGLSNDIETLIKKLSNIDNAINDHLGSRDYRAAMVPVLIRRAISDALRQVQGE